MLCFATPGTDAVSTPGHLSKELPSTRFLLALNTLYCIGKRDQDNLSVFSGGNDGVDLFSK